MLVELDNRTDSDSKIPFWIWLLAACGLLCGALILGLFTSHLFALDELSSSALAQRRRLASITAGLQRSVSAISESYEDIFERSTSARAHLEIESLPWSVGAGLDDLPPAVQHRLQSIQEDFESATRQVADCLAWQQKLGQTASDRLAYEQRATLALQQMRQQIDNLLRDVRDQRDADLQRIRDGGGAEATLAAEEVLRDAAGENQLRQLAEAWHELEKQILLAANEQDQRRLRTKGYRQVVRTADHFEEALDVVTRTRGAAVTAPIADLLEGLRRVLLGTPAPSGGSGRGLLTIQLDWLAQNDQRDELRQGLARQLSRLHEARSGLHQLMSYTLVSANGELRDRLHDLWVTSLIVGLGAAALLLGAVRAITRSMGTRMREYAQSQRAALEAVRAQGLFLANMSHEIRTPMNGVLGMAEMLESSALDNDQRQIARTIRTSAESLLTVINDILDFSKIQEGKLELHDNDFDLRNTIEDMLELLAHMATAKGNELLCFIDPSVPRLVRGDSDRLRQVLLNLTGNAVKFTHQGEVTVLVDLLAHYRDLVRLQFTVSDTGVGISQEAQARLFRPFSQGDSRTTRRFGGTGLGLTISKRLVQMMGGDITVRSTVGVGSTFTFTVALRAAQAPADPSSDAVDFTGRSVLIVDDNEANREILAMRLAGWRMSYDAADSAADALLRLQEARDQGHAFDVMLIDLQMPDVDGLDLSRRIAADATLSRAPRILLSSTDVRPKPEMLAISGIAAWLGKPVRESRLRECLQSLLGVNAGGSKPAPTSQKEAEQLRCHVLVAEDNVINQRVLREMLDRLGCTAVFTVNGAEALAQVQQNDFDVVLMDCQMPEMDGLTAARHIRKLPAAKGQVPIIALTANVLPADRRACLEAGMNDFLSKPIKKDQLRAALAEWAAAPVART
jgi:signal transduction histidine kinase/DNA-binding response OmpR family regulator